MKPLKTLKTRKLAINKETLRTLTTSDLERAQGGIQSGGSAWCSSGADRKCSGNSYNK